MPRASKVCSTPGCPEVIPAGTSRCPDCTTKADHARGTARQRGYGGAHETRFRRQVLARDPICVIPGCYEWAQHADHYPVDRRTLVLRGEDPNDPKHGRGICHKHHSSETAKHQSGGWNTR